MRPVMIVMSHGNMAAETVNSAKMIVGEMENVFVISMKEDDGLSGTMDKLESVLATLDLQTEIVILIDLKGGTPGNTALMKLGSYPNLHVVSGLNLAMMIEAALSPLTSSASLASHLETVGRNAVEKLTLAEETDEEEYEE